MNTSPAWAVCWSAIGTLQAKHYNWTNKHKITQNTYSPAYTYQSVRPDEDFGCLAGTSLVSVLQAVKNRKGRKYTEYLEFCDEKPLSAQEKDRASTDSVFMDYVVLFGHSTPRNAKIEAVKQALYNGMPVVTGMQCPPSFHTAGRFWQPRENPAPPGEAQALCVIGYDDTQYGGAFEVLNSWGRAWGDSGYTWVRYDDFNTFMEIGYGMYMLDIRNHHGFSGTLSLEMANAAPMPLELTHTNTLHTKSAFGAGTYFRLHLECENAGFVYVFGSNDKGQVFDLLSDKSGESVTIAHRNAALTIPGKDQYIGITDPPAGEYLCILYSITPPNIGQIHSQAGLGKAALLHHLAPLLPRRENMAVLKNGVSFSALHSTQQAIFLMVDLTPHATLH